MPGKFLTMSHRLTALHPRLWNLGTWIWVWTSRWCALMVMLVERQNFSGPVAQNLMMSRWGQRKLRQRSTEGTRGMWSFGGLEMQSQWWWHFQQWRVLVLMTWKLGSNRNEWRCRHETSRVPLLPILTKFQWKKQEKIRLRWILRKGQYYTTGVCWGNMYNSCHACIKLSSIIQWYVWNAFDWRKICSFKSRMQFLL